MVHSQAWLTKACWSPQSHFASSKAKNHITAIPSDSVQMHVTSPRHHVNGELPAGISLLARRVAITQHLSVDVPSTYTDDSVNDTLSFRPWATSVTAPLVQAPVFMPVGPGWKKASLLDRESGNCCPPATINNPRSTAYQADKKCTS